MALPAYRCGKKILVRRGDLEKWLEKNRYRPEPISNSRNYEHDERICNPKEWK
jgi:hypothetical protein